MKGKILTLFFLALYTLTCAQERTLGGMLHSEQAFDGYTIFSPTGSTSTFLVNNCGEKVHEWPSTKRPGNSVYLQNDGSIYRAGQDTEAEFGAPGLGGYIEHIAWNGDLLWSYKYSSSSYLQHHDFHVMPNGNVLILAWDVHTEEEAVSFGRDPSKLTEGELWSEHIIEIQPVGTNGGEVIWEWYLWDHLIQDYDDSKENYGDVMANPNKVDINYTFADGADWIHANSVNYSQENDYVIISSPFFNELWIIDHNTTIEEASGEKGDILYRWGNPQTYRMGGDQHLFFQHTVEWIPSGLPFEGKIILFNNGRGRMPVEYSNILIIDPFDDQGDFWFADGVYGPESYEWEYVAPVPEDFYASFISGAQMLPNGNVLINDGPKGDFFEVNSTGDVVWEYINPISSTGIVYSQGDVPGGNLVFRASKHPVNFSGFSNKDLSAKGFVENAGVLLPDCSVLGFIESDMVSIYPNPARDVVFVQFDVQPKMYQIFDLHGRVMKSVIMGDSKNLKPEINIQNLKPGLYVLSACYGSGDCTDLKFIKR